MDAPDALRTTEPDARGGEREIAADLARKALIVAPGVVLAAGLLRGWDGALGAAIGMVVVVANFTLLAKAMDAGARISPQTVAAAALMGYVALLVAVTVIAVILREVAVVDLSSFVITVAVAHLGLLFLELPRIGLTLGAPGLKPKPLSKTARSQAAPATTADKEAR